MRSPGLIKPGAIVELYATAQGSVIAANSNEIFSGIRCNKRDATFA
ncbi:unannotated protein [freshwater metagenome]|uniref:Unannotated protein n=1 Tax=freshwater metagenome TaxID=449393 RepID=A0A6J6NM28_9ZZZZ